MDQFSEDFEITKDLALWSIRDAKNVARQSPGDLCRRQIVVFREMNVQVQ